MDNTVGFGSTVAMLRVFVGKNSDKFLNKWGFTEDASDTFIDNALVKPSMNWYAFFFGIFYLGYRKLYKEVAVYSLVTVIISTILAMFVENTIFFDLVSWVIVGVLFNTYYLDKAKKAILKAEELKLTYDEEVNLLASRGGTSKVGIIIAFAILVGITFAVEILTLLVS